METKNFAKLAALQEEKKELKAREKEINEEIRNLQEPLLEQMDEEGVDKITVVIGQTDDGTPIRRTVHKRRQVWASSNGDMPGLIQALNEVGLDEEYVEETVNAQRLSAYVRQFDDGERPMSAEQIVAQLPEPLQNAVKVTEKIELNSVKA